MHAQNQYEAARPQPPQLNMGHDPMWSPQSPPPEVDNFISEDQFQPIYPDLNEVVIQSKPIVSRLVFSIFKSLGKGYYCSFSSHVWMLVVSLYSLFHGSENDSFSFTQGSVVIYLGQTFQIQFLLIINRLDKVRFYPGRTF